MSPHSENCAGTALILDMTKELMFKNDTDRHPESRNTLTSLFRQIWN